MSTKLIRKQKRLEKMDTQGMGNCNCIRIWMELNSCFLTSLAPGFRTLLLHWLYINIHWQGIHQKKIYFKTYNFASLALGVKASLGLWFIFAFCCKDRWLSKRLIMFCSSSSDWRRLWPLKRLPWPVVTGLDQGTLELLHPNVLQNRILFRTSNFRKCSLTTYTVFKNLKMGKMRHV